MITIKNFDTRNTLSTYTLGDVCSFYLRNNNIPNLKKLKQNDFKREDIKLYKKALRTAIKENPEVKTSTGCYNREFTRAIGVIVDTYKTSCPTGVDTITVLFRLSNKKFVLNQYVVGSSYFNHKWENDVVPAAVINLAAA